MLTGAVSCAPVTEKLIFMLPPTIWYVPLMLEKVALSSLSPWPVALTDPEPELTVPDAPPVSTKLLRVNETPQPRNSDTPENEVVDQEPARASPHTVPMG